MLASSLRLLAPLKITSSRSSHSFAPHPTNQTRWRHSPARASSAEQVAAWSKTTDRLVGSASIPFSILVLPQVIQNFVNITKGNAAALSIISWEGYLSALLGNTLMCSHFADRGERSAVTVQLVGICNNMLVLAQMALTALMPMPVFLAVAGLVGMAVAISLARVSGKLPAESSQPGQLGTWRTWQLASGLFGLSVVPQVFYNVLYPTSQTLAPGLTTLAITGIYFGLMSRGPGQGQKAAQLPGSASTLLFALSPLPQLVRNFLEPTSLAGLSVGTMLLALAGNALMVPRALLVRDSIWLMGTVWACIATVGQLLSMFISRTPSTGLRYIQPELFLPVVLTLAAYFGYVLYKDAQVKQSGAPLVGSG